MGKLIDFSKETFGYIRIHGLEGEGQLSLYYGESREEALDSARCETLDYIHFDGSQPSTYTHDESKAYRYVQVQGYANQKEIRVTGVKGNGKLML